MNHISKSGLTAKLKQKVNKRTHMEGEGLGLREVEVNKEQKASNNSL